MVHRIGLMVAPLLVLVAITGCQTPPVPLPMVLPSDDAFGFQILTPRTQAERCRWTGPIGGAAAAAEMTDSLLSELVGRHDEADILRNVAVRQSATHVGIAARHCVSVEGT